MYATMRAEGGEGADPELLKLWCTRNHELYDFLTAQCGLSWTKNDMLFTGMEDHALYASVAPATGPVPHGLLTEGGGEALFGAIKPVVLAVPGVTFQPLTRVTRLIQDPDTRRVVGVVTREVDDKGVFVVGAVEKTIKALKGVLITTGSFSKDAGMVARHSPDLARLTNVANAFADGSGIRMGQAVGGDLHLMKGFWGANLSTLTVAKFPQSVLVNTEGFRFVPEDCNFYMLGHRMVRTFPKAFLISDASVHAAAPTGAYTGATIEALVAAINAGENMKLSAAVLKGTLDAYNSLANADGRTGTDPAFLKNPKYVKPLVTGPFYAVKILSTAAIGTTTGGLRINTKAQLLNQDGAVIPCAYAAGTCASGAPSEVYTGSGTAISSCLTFGRIAAEGLVAETAWAG
jgi:succinate dehydrogenase/fumarate reductase flavoprotein subunit